MGLAYSRRCQAECCDAGAITGAGGQVAGHGEGLRRQGGEAHVTTPVVEQTPLGAIDAASVIREGGGDALVGGPQGRRGGGIAG